MVVIGGLLLAGSALVNGYQWDSNDLDVWFGVEDRGVELAGKTIVSAMGAVAAYVAGIIAVQVRAELQNVRTMPGSFRYY